MTLRIIKKAGDEIKENCQFHEDIFLPHHILRINPQEKSYLNINFMVVSPWNCLFYINLFVKIEHSKLDCCLKSFAEFIFRDRKPSLMGNSPSGRKLAWHEFGEGTGFLSQMFNLWKTVAKLDVKITTHFFCSQRETGTRITGWCYCVLLPFLLLKYFMLFGASRRSQGD